MLDTSELGKGYYFSFNSFKVNRHLSFSWVGLTSFTSFFLPRTDIFIGVVFTIIDSQMGFIEFLSLAFPLCLSFCRSTIRSFLELWLVMLSSMSCARVVNSSKVWGCIPWRMYRRPQCIPCMRMSTVDTSDNLSLQLRLKEHQRLIQSITDSSFHCQCQ